MKSILIIVILLLIHSIGYSLADFQRQTVKNGKFLGKYPIPKKTSFPIKINTDEVKNAFLPPLAFIPTLSDQLILTNNGYAVEGTLNQKLAGSIVYGGPFFADVYRFFKIRYYWAANDTGNAATAVEGQNNTPLEATTFWYNHKKYGSFEESKKHRDGMIVFSLRIKITTTFNINFVDFTNKLHKIKDPGSTVHTNFYDTFKWFDYYNLRLTEYFTFPSLYRDLTTGEEFDCATAIVYRPVVGSISEQQFADTFLLLKNKEGGRLSNSIKPNSQDNIPVVLAGGGYQIFIP